MVSTSLGNASLGEIRNLGLGSSPTRFEGCRGVLEERGRRRENGSKEGDDRKVSEKL